MDPTGLEGFEGTDRYVIQRRMRVWIPCILSLVVLGSGFAQAPAGSILGVIADQSEAVIPKAVVTVTNVATGSHRIVTTGDDGAYVIPALPPGDYEVKAEAAGMGGVIRRATVEAGSATAVNLTLTVAGVQDAVTVAGVSPQLQYSSNRIAGVVTRMPPSGSRSCASKPAETRRISGLNCRSTGRITSVNTIW